MTTLKELMRCLPRPGKLVWIGLRPARGDTLLTPASVEASTTQGLIGDRYAGRTGQRHVTLIQHEHLAVIAALSGHTTIDPAQLRRNMVIAGVNLLALKQRRFRIGTVELEHTGACHPCSQMESALGPGGYNAVRGHGGITARVVSSGVMTLGDQLDVLDTPTTTTGS